MPRPLRMTKKLDDLQRMCVLRMYAENVGPSAISKWIKENWDIDYAAQSVKTLVNRESHQADIKRFKEDYLKRVKDVPIANKRIRIDDLEKVRVKIMEQIENNSLETKAQKEEFRFIVRSLNDTLMNAREEMEKKPFLMVGLGDFGDKSDEQLIAEREELLRQASRLVTGPVIEVDSTAKGIDE